MSLADVFPENIKNDFANRNIDIGKTLLVKIPHFNLSYSKYWIIVAINNPKNQIAGVVINTEINQNFAYNQYLKSQHLLITQSQHPFLKYDSYVDCANLQKIPFKEVYNAIIKNPQIVVGNVADDLLRDIHLKITLSTTISQKDKKDFGFCPQSNE